MHDGIGQALGYSIAVGEMIEVSTWIKIATLNRFIDEEMMQVADAANVELIHAGVTIHNYIYLPRV